jgi:erythromycin esterase-like protein
MAISDRRSWSEPTDVEPAAEELRAYSRSVAGPRDLDDLVDRLADAEVVLLGEASHGTSEFYRWRASLTAELVGDRDFGFVAVEGDWPSCFAVNRFVKGFERWPTWMWANWEAAECFE